MGLFDFVKKGAQEMFIARPDEAKDLIVYKWPDRTIPMKAQITVGQDECALFYKDGKFVGRLDAGRHTLETQNIPFLSVLMDSFTGGNVLMAEVWFVMLREVGGMQFGGRIGDVEDPKSGMAIGTMVHGDFSIQVEDPMKVIGFFGQRSVVHRRGILGLVQEPAAQGDPRSHRRAHGEAEHSAAQRDLGRAHRRDRAGRDRGRASRTCRRTA